MRITGLCVAGALLALVIKRGSPESALLLTLAAVVVGLVLLAEDLRELMAFFRELGARSGMAGTLFAPLYKIVGIAVVVKVGGNLCRDAGESALGTLVETAGAVCALLAALPLLRAVLKLLQELMG